MGYKPTLISASIAYTGGGTNPVSIPTFTLIEHEPSEPESPRFSSDNDRPTMSEILSPKDN